jgi:predicted amidohydrolase YtcJ
MDSVFVNGKIYVDRGHFEEAMLVKDGKIAMVGKSKAVLAAAAEECEFVNLEGHTVVPGFNDSHLHLQLLGRNLGMVQLYGTASMAELITRSKDFLATHDLPAGQTLGGWGWNQDYFTDGKRMPNRHDLDKIATDRPIVFFRACGHAASVNSKALEALHFTAATKDPEGGQLGREENGEPDGIFYEHGTDMLAPIMPQPVAETFAAEIKAAMDYAASMGLTTLQSNDVTETNSTEMIAALRLLEKRGELSCRYYGQCNFLNPSAFAKFIKDDERAKNNDLVQVGPLKLFVDGSLGARTALLRGKYADDAKAVGIKTLSDEVFDEFVRMADVAGYGVVTHCIGDGAVEMVLDSYHKVIKDGKNPNRHGVVHCQITDKPMLERIKADDVQVLAQPIFIHYDMKMVRDRVGDELAETSYAFGTLTRMGVHLSYGTDCPVEDLNPYNNLHCAVTRKGLEGDEVYLPGEKVDISTAIDNYTAASAFCCGDEARRGRLKEGYFADFVVLDRDIFEIPEDEIKDVRPVATYMGGNATYKKA